MTSRRSLSPWRREVIRSNSLPRIIRSLSGEDGEKKSGVTSWAPGWLLTPQLTRKAKKEKKNIPTSSSGRRPLLRRTPLLTLLLIRLDENIQSYCEELSDPTVERAAAASTILEAAVATASSPISSPSSSSANTPPTSPASPRSSASAIVLEGEWERFVSPLMLLAGAEAIFAQMEHVFDIEQQQNTSKRLMSLYQKIKEDLVIVKETLCDPFMGETKHTETSDILSKRSEMSSHIMSNKAASSLTIALDALVAVTFIRRELLGLHHDIFHPDSKEKDLLELSVRCRSLLKDLPECTKQTCGAGLVLIESVMCEIKAMAAALGAAYHLQRCCFMDTVLNAKMLKVHMKATPSTTLQLWFRRTLENLLAVMPVFFHRIDAFATPLYGFDKKHLIMDLPDVSMRNENLSKGHKTDERMERVGLVHDYDSTVLEFLRRHESKGGNSMAVTVVLDAVTASSFHFGRGFDNGKDNVETPSEEWPAVYMRTTIHSGSSSSTLRSGVRGTLGIASQKLLKTSSRRDVPGGDDDFTSSLRLNWSSDGGSPKNRKRKADPRLSVLEYPADAGRPSWPHNEWAALVPNLQATNKPIAIHESMEDHETESGPSTPGVRTFSSSQQSLEKDVSDDGDPGINGSKGSPLAIPWAAESEAEVPSRPTVKQPPMGSSVHHLKRLNEHMWLVVMVKEEESRWNLRRSRGCGDEDIHSFIEDMSSKLDVQGNFLDESVKSARKKSSGRDDREISLTGFSSGGDWRDFESYRFLGSLKETFGLRPQSPMRQSLKNPYFNGRGRSLQTVESTPSNSNSGGDDLDSAISFFFGPELSSILFAGE